MKHFRTLIPLACLLSAITLSAQVPGELAITNPGSESGDLSGWNMWPGDDPITGEANVNLELTFKDNTGENLSNLGYEGARVWSENQIDESAPIGEWHFLELFIQCPPINPEHTVDRIDCNLRLYQWGEAWGIVYVDDVFIAQGSSTIDDVKSVKRRLPIVFSLSQNYPNPFNNVTMINYQLPKASEVELIICNLLGQKGAIAVSERQQAGQYQATFNGANLPSGIYYYQLVAGDYREVKKMILIK
jgi:hypothetical protein